MIGIWCTVSYSSEILACHSLGNPECWMTSMFTSWAVRAHRVSTPLWNITWSLIPLPHGHPIWCFWLRYCIYFFPALRLFMLPQLQLFFFTHKGCLCVETHVKGNSWDHTCTKRWVCLILWGSPCSLTCWYLKAILILWHLVTNRNWFKVQLMASEKLGSSGADTNKGLLLLKYSVVICLLGWNPQQLGGWHQVGWKSWSAS